MILSAEYIVAKQISLGFRLSLLFLFVLFDRVGHLFVREDNLTTVNELFHLVQITSSSSMRALNFELFFGIWESVFVSHGNVLSSDMGCMWSGRELPTT